MQTPRPGAGVDLRVAGQIGMAVSFAGVSRALFTSVVFALEITRQFDCLLTLETGCSTAVIVSALAMRTTIMTEKLVRRGHHVPSEFVATTRDT